jgi:acyl-CoA synthetase (NDP forming)
VVTVPAAGIMNLIPQLKAKGVKNMVLITSGFGETGADGKALENQLVEEARAGGILVLGPNTMESVIPTSIFSAWEQPSTPWPVPLPL